MTEPQKYYYFELWTAAARAIGCKKSDNARRHAETVVALGYPRSSKLFDNNEFDRIKRHLVALAAGPLNLQATIDELNPQEEERKRIMWRIDRLQVPKETKDRILKFQYNVETQRQLEHLPLHALNRYRVGLIEEERKLKRQQIRRAASVPSDQPF